MLIIGILRGWLHHGFSWGGWAIHSGGLTLFMHRHRDRLTKVRKITGANPGSGIDLGTPAMVC
ncbi:MAG: hypothetical protein MI919_04980 [Holophagales bacterium]|nr:hypothetical protein [Holophagales bacterium]